MPLLADFNHHWVVVEEEAAVEDLVYSEPLLFGLAG